MKFLYGDYNFNTGKSTVTLADRYGRYTGYAKLHPDDKDNESHYMGCNIAEKRALIKGLKNRRRRTKIKLNAIENVTNEIQMNVFPKEEHKEIKKILYSKIKDYSKQIKRIDELIEEIENSIKERIQMREKILSKGQKK